MRGVGAIPGGMQAAGFALIGGVGFVVDAISHRPDVLFVTVIGENEAGAFGKRHGQIAHVIVVVDLHGHRLVLDGFVLHRAKKVPQRHADAGLGGPVPIYLQN